MMGIRGFILTESNIPKYWRVTPPISATPHFKHFGLLVNPVNHLHRVPVPMLFVQGSRDEDFTDLRELQPVLDELGNRATLHVIEGADHFYYLPAGSNRTRLDAL